MASLRRITFCFDVQCPYACMAAHKLAALQRASPRLRAAVTWRPVLLGGLYKLTDAPQGKDGSATDVMSPAKQAVTGADTLREARRAGIDMKFNSRHPIRSVTAQRLLVSAPEDVVPALALRLYRAYWRDDEDVADAAVLGRIAAEFGLDLSAAEAAPAKDGLRRNTQEAFERGAFGVPAFWVEGARNGYAAPGEPGRLFWGQDRLHFALHAAGLPRELCEPPQLVEDARLGAGRALTFYHDFSSPWSYLASLRVREVAAASGATVKFVPILLGALFRAIGTHNTPVVTMSEAKRNYATRDHADWCRWWGAEFNFTSNFPLRTVAALRVSIVEPTTIECLYRAAWVEDRNIGDAEELVRVLDDAGFDGAALLAATADAAVKEELKRNTQAAMDAGACGVPSFQVDGEGPLIWGQDRWATVTDMLRGWDATIPDGVRSRL